MPIGIPCDTVDVALLRPQEANRMSRQILQLVEDNPDPQAFTELVKGDNKWEMDHAIATHDSLRMMIEDIAERVGTPARIREYQLRRQDQRDCYTSDLELLSSSDRFDDLIEDFGATNAARCFHFARGSAEEFSMQRIFLADEKSEHKVEKALTSALDFSNVKI